MIVCIWYSFVIPFRIVKETMEIARKQRGTDLPSSKHKPAPFKEPWIGNTWKFTKENLLDTPSIRGGMTPSKEAWTRVRACAFATKCGEALGLYMNLSFNINKSQPESINMAKLFIHRFYMRNDFSRINYHDVVPSALFITTKLQDNYRRVRDIVYVCAKKSKKDESYVIDENDKVFII